LLKFLLTHAVRFLLLLAALAPLSSHAANFSDSNRWTSTATNGTLPGIGSRMTLTWSIVPDGLVLGTVYTDPVTNPSHVSRLIARFDELYNVPLVDRVADLTARPWFAEMQTVFNIYGSKTGITYVYVSDDGAATGSPGAVGARGDVRIGGTDLSGPLAYNGGPPSGDMVINTASTVFSAPSTLRLIFGHEHAHGLGLGHVLVTGNATLSVVSGSGGNSNGAQLDDLSVILRAYGDVREKAPGDATLANARSLGSLPASTLLTVGTLATNLPVLAAETDFPFSSHSTDVDFFKFSVTSAQSVIVKLTPQGPTYSYLPEGGVDTTIKLSNQADLTLQLQNSGGTQLVAKDLVGTGLIEGIAFDLPAAGDYFVRVGNKTAKGQFYRLDIGSPAAFEPSAGNYYQAEFKTAGDVEGWVGSPHLPDLTATGGALVGTSTGNDPYIIRSGLFFHGGASGEPGASKVLIRFRSTGGSSGQLWWTTNSASNYAAERRVDFSYTSNSTWQTIVVDLSTHPLWNGQLITGLRIDTSGNSGVTFDIDAILVSDGDFDGDGLADIDEDWGDVDTDGLANYEDTDADGDGTPDGVEITRGSDPRSPAFAFEFNTPGNFEGWDGGYKDYDSTGVTGGLMSGSTTGGDPYQSRNNLTFPATAASHLIFRVRSSGGSGIQVFWATKLAGIAAARSTTFTYTGNGQYKILSVDLSSDPDWAGTITKLRFDWPQTSGLTCDMDYFRSSDGDFDNDGIPDASDGFTDTDSDGLANYEDSDSDGDRIPDAYEFTNSMNFLSAADAVLDNDRDGFSNRDEYTAGTSPNDPSSRFSPLSSQLVAPDSCQLRVAGVAGRKYKLLRSTTLTGAWQMIDEIPMLGTAQVVTLTDPAAPAIRAFYKIEVSIP
jgi:hypothetical protein